MTETIAVTIYGASDDCLEVESSDGTIKEEYDCYDRACYIELEDPEGDSVVVRGRYTRDGWSVELYRDNEPGWVIEETQHPIYDEEFALTIHVPVGTVAEQVY